MDIPWDDVRLFLAVADAGSLSAAARQLRVAQPTVSRRLAELETHLGEPLFARGVEGTLLTAFGEGLVGPARRMAEWAAEVERAAERADTEPRGVVRLTAPPGVAFEVVAPFAALMKKELPRIRLEVVSTVSYLDLSRREADIALRTQAPTQRDVVTLATLEFVSVPFATKEYRANLPRRAKLEDVDWIGWAPPLDHLPPNRELARIIPDFRPVFASDDFLVQVRAAEAGLGAIFLGRVSHRFRRDSPLVELDVALPPVPSSLHLVAAKSALGIPRVARVAERLRQELAKADTRKRH
ncbi:MAG: LysR family transcriptional regulator [Polyangiaceae bacterium]